MAAAPERRMRESSRAKRQAILDAATELFLADGYAAASMNQIVARVGGSKGTIYAWFSNKEDLFRTILDEKLVEHFSPVFAIDSCRSDLRADLELISRHILEAITSENGIALMRLVISEAKRSPEIGQLLQDHILTPLSRTLEDHLREVGSREKINGIKTRTAVEYFLGMLVHRTFMEQMLMPGKTPGRRAIHAQAKKIVNDFLKMSGL